MKTIQVVAAIIIKNNKVFATQRGYGDFEGSWEFPGGKIEPNEQPEEALIREIREELSAEISVDQFITTIEYDYPAFHLTMHCFICSVKEGQLTLLEHTDSKWLEKSQLNSIDWLPADIEVIKILEQIL